VRFPFAIVHVTSTPTVLSTFPITLIHVLAVTVFLACAPLPFITTAVSISVHTIALEFTAMPLSFVVRAIMKMHLVVGRVLKIIPIMLNCTTKNVCFTCIFAAESW
jgi:hypothetical protein